MIFLMPSFSSSKSKFCNMKQRNPSKPMRIHIKNYGIGDCNGGYLFGWYGFYGCNKMNIK